MLFRAAIATAVVGATAASAAVFVRGVLPPDGAAAQGVTIDGDLVGREAPRAVAERAAKRRLDRRVRVTFGGEALVEGTLAELGAVVDVASVEAAALEVARAGDLFQQVDAAFAAKRGTDAIRTHVLLPADVIAARLALRKDELDTPPTDAKLDVVAKKAKTAHEPGRYLDAFATAEAVQRAVDASEAAAPSADVAPPIELAASMTEIAPAASSAAVERIDTSAVVSRYETRYGFLGGQANRAQNIARAASQMEGVVLMPGEAISFNHLVGPRSIENGFATAPEIYKGELREGVGGGTCQVAGTLHAAAYLGGLDVLERANHSRPSGYIRMGLDATVVYPTVDLRLRNPFDFPVVIHATFEKGVLVFELLGKERPAAVAFATEIVGTADFKRKVEEKPGLPEGKFVLKQHGIHGYSVKKTRTIHLVDGRERVETTEDVYPPTFEIYEIPPGFDPAALPAGPEEKAHGAA